jgi:thiol:disulfide interchange protein
MKTPAKLLIFGVLFAFAAGSAFSAGRSVYPPPAQAKSEIAAALKTAAATHKRVLLDFGGNWCPDCIALDLYFHNAANRPLLTANFVLVHVNVGRYTANLDLAAKYGIPLKKGVPALAVLSPRGKLLYSQQNGQFEAMSHMDSSAVTAFLKHWRPARPGCSVVMTNC